MKKGELFLRSCYLSEREIPLSNGQFIALFTFEYLEKATFWYFGILKATFWYSRSEVEHFRN